jgi:predicted secreted Zn-dependent protease
MKAFTIIEVLITAVLLVLVVFILKSAAEHKLEAIEKHPAKYHVNVYAGSELVRTIEANSVTFGTTRVIVREAKTGRYIEIIGTVISEPILEIDK